MKTIKQNLLALLLVVFSLSSSAQQNLIRPGYLYRVQSGKSGKRTYICGQRPFDNNGRLVGVNDLPSQIRQVFQNITASLATVGLAPRHIVQVDYHLKTRTDAVVSDVAKSQLLTLSLAFFGQNAPALSQTKAVSQIVRDDVLIEIEVIAEN